MRNVYKARLKQEVLYYKSKGHSLDVAIGVLKGDYGESTIRKYWKIFCEGGKK